MQPNHKCYMYLKVTEDEFSKLTSFRTKTFSPSKDNACDKFIFID